MSKKTAGEKEGKNDLLHQVQQSKPAIANIRTWSASAVFLSEHSGVGQLDTKQQFLTAYIIICISEHSAYVYFTPTLYLISRLQVEAETL